MENLKFEQLDLNAQALSGLNRPFNEWDEDTKLVIEQFLYTWGCGRFENIAPKINGFKQTFFTSYTGSRVFKYEINFSDNTLYQVGARDFMEYIAHKVESRFWKTNHPDMPYKIPDLIFDYLGYSHLSDEVRVCIVEYCMFNDNPMHRFYQLMTEDFRNDLSTLNNYHECVEYLLKLDWFAVGTGFDSIFTKSQRRLVSLKESLLNKYQNRFTSISKWIDLVVDYSNDNFSNKFIFSEMLMMSEVDFVSFMKRCISDIGIPLVFNLKQESVSLLPEGFDKGEFIQFYSSSNFMNFICSNNQQCPQGQYCANNNPHEVNIHCASSPLTNYVNSEGCPISKFLSKY